MNDTPSSTQPYMPTGLVIHDVEREDLPSILAINNAADAGVAPLAAAELARRFETAAYFRTARTAGELAGFLIGLRADDPCTDPGFAWFRERYPQFVYIDRIVIANAHRRHGLGGIFYADVQSFAEPRVALLACAVTLQPRNDAAVFFHGTHGFRELGQAPLGAEGRIGLLGKELACHAFIRNRYGAVENLPPLPWLADRQPHRAAS